jgi:hypothetical protein
VASPITLFLNTTSLHLVGDCFSCRLSYIQHVSPIFVAGHHRPEIWFHQTYDVPPIFTFNQSIHQFSNVYQNKAQQHLKHYKKPSRHSPGESR